MDQETRQKRYKEFMKRHDGFILHICAWRARGDFFLSDEYYQESCLYLWKHLDQLHPGASTLEERAWLYFRLRSAIRRSYKRHTRGETLVDLTDMENIPDTDIPSDEILALHQSIALLPEKDRHIITLYCQGYSLKEIGLELGISANAVSTRISRIAKKIKQMNQ